MKAQVAKDRRSYGKTPAAQSAALKKARMTEQELENQARLKVIQQKIQARVFKNVKVSDADVRKFYDDNKDKFTIPESRVVRQILVQSQPLAKRLMNMARSGSDFGALARQYSTDKPTASVGGKVAIRKGQTSPAFDKVAFSIATGKISEPIVTQYGWQILQAITPVQLAVVTPLSKVSSEIRRELLQSAAREGARTLADRREERVLRRQGRVRARLPPVHRRQPVQPELGLEHAAAFGLISRGQIGASAEVAHLRHSVVTLV